MFNPTSVVDLGSAASWANFTYNFANANLPTNTINSKQIMIRYENGGTSTALGFYRNNNNDGGQPGDGDYIFVFQIIARDASNNIEYVLASYKDESYNEHQNPTRNYYLINNQIFITPSKTTTKYYFPVTSLTADMSGHTFCVNGLGVLGSRTTNFVAIGAENNPAEIGEPRAGNDFTNPIFKYNGVAPTMTGVINTTGTIIEVISASNLVLNNYYVIKILGTVNWAAIGAASPIVVGRLFKYNGFSVTAGITGCCLETTDLDLTGLKLIARASVATAWGDPAAVLASSPSYLTTTPLVNPFNTTYVARKQSSTAEPSNAIEYGYGGPYGSNINQTNERTSGGNSLDTYEWRQFPTSEFPLLFSA